jgi:hypothetical protein
MTDVRYRLKKLENDTGVGEVPYVVLFHSEDGTLRDHDGDVYLHVANDLFQNQRTDTVVMSALFCPESLRLCI